MSNRERFAEYAAAFEKTLLDDDWTRLERYFSADAAYLPGDGNEHAGRDAVFQALRDSVNSLDRKCDTREFVGQPSVTEEGDTVTLTFSVKYGKKGIPDLVISGKETVRYADGVIQRMEDFIDDPAGFGEWMAKHGAALG